MIFPFEAAYFKEKISGNAHSLAGEGRTIGFSGTDDNKLTMPANIISTKL